MDNEPIDYDAGMQKTKALLRTILRITLPLCLVGSLQLSGQSKLQITPAVTKWLQGLETHKQRLDDVMARLKRQKDGPNSSKLVPLSLGCPVALESALAVALTDAHLTNPKGDEDFHLVFNSDQKDEPLDVLYRYNKRGALTMTIISRIPKDWQIAFQPGEANLNQFVVIGGPAGRQCAFQLNSQDPFDSRAVSNQVE
jgi:hypothetical protein